MVVAQGAGFFFLTSTWEKIFFTFPFSRMGPKVCKCAGGGTIFLKCPLLLFKSLVQNSENSQSHFSMATF